MRWLSWVLGLVMVGLLWALTLPVFAANDHGGNDAAAPRGSVHGHMSVFENGTANTIDTAGAWHLIYTAGEWITGDILSDVTYQDGAVETVSGAYADAGGTPNSVTVTAAGFAASGFADGDFISITGSTNYNSVFEVQNTATNSFTIVSAFNAEGAAGTITRGGSLTMNQAGSYFFHYTLSAAPQTNNHEFDVVLFSGTSGGLPLMINESETRFESKLAGKFSNVGGGGIHTLQAGGKLTIGIKNVGATGNVTTRYANVWLHHL